VDVGGPWKGNGTDDRHFGISGPGSRRGRGCGRVLCVRRRVRSGWRSVSERPGTTWFDGAFVDAWGGLVGLSRVFLRSGLDLSSAGFDGGRQRGLVVDGRSRTVRRSTVNRLRAGGGEGFQTELALVRGPADHAGLWGGCHRRHAMGRELAMLSARFERLTDDQVPKAQAPDLAAGLRWAVTQSGARAGAWGRRLVLRVA
jgi:hypothetical protein